MTKENKVIKDLKERNDKLNNQYRERDIRCSVLEKRVSDLEKKNKELKLQLKGTTHCYDEEEHKRLQEENRKYKEAGGKINSLLYDYEMQNDEIISLYCEEIRSVLKELEQMVTGAGGEEENIKTELLVELQIQLDKLKQENNDLKKQFEDKHNITMFVDTNGTQEKLDERMGNDMYRKHLEKEKQKLQEQLSSNTLQFENQQKEFIKYLEDKLAIINNVLDTEKDEDKVYFTLIRKDVVEETLLKYKEIIGGKYEGNKNL